jgi:hypothetical protein
MLTSNGKGRRKPSRRPHRSEFSPAIPRRVAPQQGPLPLRRIPIYTSSHEAAASPRLHTCHPISVSHNKGALQCTVTVIPVIPN